MNTESYEHSFCSYHSDISPTNEVVGDERTILYGMVPWTAGGLADGHIDDEVSAYDCQDGGFIQAANRTRKRRKPKKER